MIESLRRWGASWPAKILLGVLAASMGVLWGTSDVFMRRNPLAVVATVGNAEILTQDLHREIRLRLAVLEQKLGKRLTPEQIAASRLPASVLTELIERTILDQEATRMGLMISDEMVQKAVLSNPQFQKEQKGFSRERFNQVLRASGLHEKAFLTNLKKEMRRQQLLKGLIAPLQPPEIMGRLLAAAQFQERYGACFFVSSASQDVPLSPPTRELQEAFYNREKERFRTPEKRSFAYAVLSGWTHENAQQLEDDLASGATLAELSKKHSFDIKSVPPVSRRGESSLEEQAVLDVLPEDPAFRQELLNGAYQMELGGEPIVRRLGTGDYYILSVQKSFPSQIPPFTVVQDQVVAAWMQEAREQKAFERAKDYLQAFASGQKSAGLFKKLSPVSLSRGANDEGPVPPVVKTILFEMAPGELRVVKGITGGAYVVKLLTIQNPSQDRIAPQLPVLFDQVKGMVEEDFIQGAIQSLRSRYHVKVNREALRALSL